MRYVILRDDDTSALTPVKCLERLYRPFLDRGLPVNLAVIPEVRTTVTCPDGRLEGYLAAGHPSPGAATVRTTIFNGLFGAIFGYVMACATVLVLGLIVDLAAPLFGGRRDFDSAFKLAVYSFTPVWLAGVFLVLPGLRFLMLSGFYGAYVLWLGLPRLIKVPEQKTPSFVVLIVVCACLLVYIAATAQRLVFGTPGL